MSRTGLFLLIILGLMSFGVLHADDGLSASDLHLGDASLAADVFLAPISQFACEDPSNRLDLRCNMTANQIGPDGAMYFNSPQPVPTSALCYQGDFTVPCQRRSIYRRRIDSPPELIAYIDERKDSDGVDSHVAEYGELYLDPVTCDLYFGLYTLCLGQAVTCTLYDPSVQVIRIHGLKGPKCTLRH